MAGNHPLELNRAVPGGRMERFAIEDDDYPGGRFSKFLYYHPEEGEKLRYDNAHDDENLGWHHRHVSLGEDTEISFQNITAQVARFLQEVAHLASIDDKNHD